MKIVEDFKDYQIIDMSDGEKLEKYNCVWFSVRNQEKWMRILRW